MWAIIVFLGLVVVFLLADATTAEYKSHDSLRTFNDIYSDSYYHGTFEDKKHNVTCWYMFNHKTDNGGGGMSCLPNYQLHTQ